VTTLDRRRERGTNVGPMPALPIKGTITSWQPDDSIGRIRLSSGEEIRFGHSACVGLRPAVGAEVWVVEVAPHPLGGLRAKVLNTTGEVVPDRVTAALSAHQERERLRPAVEAEVEALKAECTRLLGERPGPWDVAGDLVREITELRARMPLDEVSAFASGIRALHGGAPADHLRLYDLDWADGWHHLDLWTDPAFVPFATDGKNHLGLFAHPAALVRGDRAPVVFRFQDHDPIFAWVAESAGHFVRMIEAASRGENVDALRGQPAEESIARMEAIQREEAFEDVERGDVHALFWSGSRALEDAAAERLEARYAERRWDFPRASISAQRLLASFEDRIDTAWSKLR
jgi:hypothetical protein